MKVKARWDCMSITKDKIYEARKDNDTYHVIGNDGEERRYTLTPFEIVEEQLPEEYIVEDLDKDRHTDLEVAFLKHCDKIYSLLMKWQYLPFTKDKNYRNREAKRDVIEEKYPNIPIIAYEDWKKLYNKQTKQVNMTTFKGGDKVKLKANYSTIFPLGGEMYGHKWVDDQNMSLNQVYTVCALHSDGHSISLNETHNRLYISTNFFELATETRKIIGYKCPKDLFNGRVISGTIYKPLSDAPCPVYAAIKIGTNASPLDGGQTNLPHELVSEWEPVYEEEDLIIDIPVAGETMYLRINRLGEIEFQFSRRNDRESKGSATIIQLQNAYKHYNYGPKIGNLDTKSQVVHIGCSSGIGLEISTIEGIIKQYKDKFKK